MGIIRLPKAIETSKGTKTKIDKIKGDGLKNRLDNIKLSLVSLRNNPDKTIDEIIDLLLELIKIMENK